MKKITMKVSNTISETFEDFITSRKSKGLSEKTIVTYNQHFHTLSNILNCDMPIDDLTKEDLELMVATLRDSNLSTNSISSYVRTMKTFLSWCNEEEITTLKLKAYKCQETIKETYSDRELEILLKKPNMKKCNFSEYRSWVIVNLLVNNGTRAATIRNIKNKDVDLENYVIYLRHTKSKKSQVIPLCSELCQILREYMKIRGGLLDEYLFSNENGTQLKEYALRSSIARYNNRRGVQKTSIHLFRHTFARKYLVDCGGNAFTLQRLLGHSTLDMTKHYCAIFDADIAKNYDRFSPLSQMKQNNSKIKMSASR